MPGISGIVRCPLCGGGLSSDLVCPDCGSTYSLSDHVIDLVNKTLSADQWKWDPRTFDERFKKEADAKYESYLNAETQEARARTWAAIEDEVGALHGNVCDLATGLGSLFLKLISNMNILAVATDIDFRVLEWTAAKAKEAGCTSFYCVATDGRQLAFKDEVFDFVTSNAGIENIPDTPQVMKEVHRVLKPGGQLVALMHFIDPGSRSHMLARQHGTERASLAHLFINDLKACGFEQVDINIVASAVWANNPQDLIPAAGDIQHWAIVKATR